jgi:pimeloyl-ACP methyl ester carboxylesterase
MGHSMGANTTLQVAVDLGDKIRVAILEDPPFMMHDPEQSAARVEEIRQGMMRWLGEMQGMPLEQLVMRCIKENPTWRAEELIAWSESKQQFATKAQHFGPRHFNPWQELVRALTVPCLLIVSDSARGGLVTAEAAALARSLSSQVEVGFIRDAGHCIRRESPVAYMKMVRSFLGEK